MYDSCHGFASLSAVGLTLSAGSEAEVPQAQPEQIGLGIGHFAEDCLVEKGLHKDAEEQTDHIGIFSQLVFDLEEPAYDRCGKRTEHRKAGIAGPAERIRVDVVSISEFGNIGDPAVSEERLFVRLRDTPHIHGYPPARDKIQLVIGIIGFAEEGSEDFGHLLPFQNLLLHYPYG